MLLIRCSHHPLPSDIAHGAPQRSRARPLRRVAREARLEHGPQSRLLLWLLRLWQLPRVQRATRCTICDDSLPDQSAALRYGLIRNDTHGLDVVRR
jgi:hypothetical protein